MLEGHTMTAREAVNMVRKRAKMPNITVGDGEFWAKYQNEAFRGTRFRGSPFLGCSSLERGLTTYFTSITRMRHHS